MSIDIQNRIEKYWSNRAAGYSCRTQEELNSFKKSAWLQIIMEQAPHNHKLNILDIGTGPGFFPIVMQLAGHQATGIDCALDMLEHAAHNAAVQGVRPRFLKMDCHKLDFADNSFDMLICRNLTWTLQDPSAAYKEWLRVLKPQGVLLIFDANWYLHLFDAELQQQTRQAIHQTLASGLNNPHAGVDVDESEQIGRNLPLSSIKRPDWDLRILPSCGFSKVSVQENITDKVWDLAEKTAFGATPLFMISAVK